MEEASARSCLPDSSSARIPSAASAKTVTARRVAAPSNGDLIVSARTEALDGRGRCIPPTRTARLAAECVSLRGLGESLSILRPSPGAGRRRPHPVGIARVVVHRPSSDESAATAESGPDTCRGGLGSTYLWATGRLVRVAAFERRAYGWANLGARVCAPVRPLSAPQLGPSGRGSR